MTYANEAQREFSNFPGRAFATIRHEFRQGSLMSTVTIPAAALHCCLLVGGIRTNDLSACRLLKDIP